MAENMLRSARFKNLDQLKKALNNSPALRRGSAGEGVRAVQQALIDLDYPMPITLGTTGIPDGLYGK